MKIVVVEDELKILDGIISLINSFGGEFELRGKARNGKEGISVVLREKPDIVITDITMPILNGLEMIKEINRNNFKGKFIILSGYADFKYAQEAIKLGSVDYLLKPVTKEDLYNSLVKVKMMFENEAKQISPTNYSTEELFQKIISTSVESSAEFFEELKNRIAGDTKPGLLMIKGDIRFTQQNLDKIKKYIKYGLTHLDHYICVKSNHAEIFVLIENKRNVNLIKLLNEILERTVSEVRENIAFSYCDIDDIDKLNKAIQKVQDNINWSLSIKKPTVIHEELINSIKCDPFIYPREIEQAILNKINNKRIKEVENDLKDFIRYLNEKIYSYSDIREALVTLTVSVLYAIRRANYGIYENIEQLDLLRWVGTRLFISSYPNLIMNILMEFDRYDKNILHCNNLVINKALRIIDNEYKSDISLEDIARRLKVTPEYLSSLFIREIGVKFTTYCTEKRMEHAKALLQNDKNLKIYEVAEACGYSDVKYFCKVFKKHTGLSPSQYIHLGQ